MEKKIILLRVGALLICVSLVIGMITFVVLSWESQYFFPGLICSILAFTFGGILILIVGLKKLLKAGPKKILIAVIVICLIVFISFFAIHRSNWSGYVYTSKFDGEGNYLFMREFLNKEQCIIELKDSLKKKIIINWANLSEQPKEEILADSYFCGQNCWFPDGPGDVSIDELDCVDKIQGKIK